MAPGMSSKASAQTSNPTTMPNPLSSNSVSDLAQALNEAVDFREIIDKVLEAVAENCSPDQVFDPGILAEWAEDNGFVLAPDNAE